LRHVINDAISRPFRWLRGVPDESGPEPDKDGNEDFWALDDISFDVAQGEAVGIIGRNGAGKSTLLKILSRITEPTNGRIRLRGRVASLLEVGTGFHPELTGRENIFLNGAILGMTRAEITRKFDEIVAFAEVERFLDTPVKRYSSGMYVRLAFAVAAHLEPEILIVDEVLAVGDLAFQKKCLGKMGDVSTKEGRTVLFVSHNMGAISSLTRRAVYLRAGKLILAGPTQAVVSRYLSEAFRNDSVWKAPALTAHSLQILEVRLLDSSGAASNEFEVTDGFTIEMEYEVRKSVRQVIVEALIYNAEGIHLARLGDHDRDSSVLEGRVPGRYCSQVTVPGNILSLGIYYLRINSGVEFTETYDHTDILSFSVVENRAKSSRQGRTGSLAPMLPWRVVWYAPPGQSRRPAEVGV
jgi:lipopolysaccharide transport system ATP-binding protein